MWGPRIRSDSHGNGEVETETEVEIHSILWNSAGRIGVIIIRGLAITSRKLDFKMKCGAFREHLCCVNTVQYQSRVFLVRLNKRDSRKMLLCLKCLLLIFSNQLLSHCQSLLSRRSRRPLQNVKHLLIKRETKTKARGAQKKKLHFLSLFLVFSRLVQLLLFIFYLVCSC